MSNLDVEIYPEYVQFEVGTPRSNGTLLHIKKENGDRLVTYLTDLDKLDDLCRDIQKAIYDYRTGKV
jgi:hypothetical protein